MTNKPKDRGTRTETMLVRLFTAFNVPAERRALKGSADEGDLWLFGGKVVVEAKHRRTAPSPAQIRTWMAEADREAARVPGCDMSALVVNRPGYGEQGMAEWTVHLRIDEATHLLSGVTAHVGRPDIVSMSLGTFALLVADTYGGRV